MKKVIKLSEQDLHRIIMESVNNILESDDEMELDEGWFGDKWNQTKTAANTMFKNTREDNGFKDRLSAAKSN